MRFFIYIVQYLQKIMLIDGHYLSVYILSLGAKGSQLGILNTICMALSNILSPFTGWILDRSVQKRSICLALEC